jgi:hypothetical protein
MLQHILLEYILLLQIGVLAFPSLVFDSDKNHVLLSEPDVNTTIPTAPNTTTIPGVNWVSPPYKWFFEYPLPIPPVKQPKLSVKSTPEYFAELMAVQYLYKQHDRSHP